MIPHRKGLVEIGNFRFESGQTLAEVNVAYETWGVLNTRGDNAILICHALTGTSHAASGEQNRNAGWWEFLIGPGRTIDTRNYFVICANVLGGCSGSTGPASIDPSTQKPFGMRFPVVTVRDMVNNQRSLIDRLGIGRLHMITGASLGGMQAMEWAAMYPERVEAIMPISTPGRVYDQSIAYRKAQRKAIMMDPEWRDGDYYGVSNPAQGIELARLIGFITYRTESEFAERFGRMHRDPSLFELKARFEIECYLEHHGRKLAQWFDANTYLYLSKAMDLHDLGRGYASYEEGIQRIRAKVRVLGVSSDLLFPCYQQREFAEILSRTNSEVEYFKIRSIFGHDAFLIEQKKINRMIGGFLKAIIPEHETGEKR